MASSSPNGPRYRVVYSEVVRRQLKAIARRARDLELGREFLDAVKAIDANLRHNPTQFGEPYNDLPAAKLTVYARILRPLLVTYSVHRQRPIVFVRSFRPFPADAF